MVICVPSYSFSVALRVFSVSLCLPRCTGACVSAGVCVCFCVFLSVCVFVYICVCVCEIVH